MRRIGLLAGLVALSTHSYAARAEQPSVEQLMKKIDELQRRLDKVEGRQKTIAKKQGQAAAHVPAAAPRRPATVAAVQPVEPIPGLLPPKPMGSPYEDALRSDLPGISLRVPGAATEVRVYGFAKASGYADFNARNQNHAPSPQGIPLAGSAAALQGGDSSMTARFSRIGLDTRTLTSLGTLETRVEGDFAGGPAASNNLVFRLRQAWGEFGDDSFRVLVGQANSLWNEVMFETLNDSTNLNQSFVRQAQIRFTGRLAPGWTGQVSLEAPDTQYTSVAGTFFPDTSFLGGPSPSFTTMPDLLGRLTYRDSGFEFDARALARRLSIHTAGTAAGGANTDTFGWGVASHVRIPMRWLSNAFGADQFVAMGYYGEGVGRYFAGNMTGQDLLTNLGMPGVTSLDYDTNTVPAYGGTLAYRRFWSPQLRSTFAYSYARQDYPAYALGFTPGSASATSLNGQMQQGIVNLIWSPYATEHNGVVDTGWLDAGIEYIYTKRDVFGGAAATGAAGAGYGVANRFMAAAIVRF
ncbi:MAG: porin [Xanthobacteraceae bacterium]|nr:porin [Xanthobacteraceae bacterium]